MRLFILLRVFVASELFDLYASTKCSFVMLLVF